MKRLHALARATILARGIPSLILLAALLGVTLATPVEGQETSASASLTLTVRAEASGTPLAGAEVSAGDTSARTNLEGVASLRLPPGSHTILVRMFGFAQAEVPVSLRAGQDTTVVVTLEERVLELEEIIVSSTRGDRRIEDEPLRVEVITREEVEEKILMTPGDIVMLLGETAGIRIQPSSPSLGGASVRIQGLRGRYTQILSDGLPLYGGGSALGALQIPPMDLGQVEVIKGAASALYGSTALGGVVNLISRRPEDERELLLNQTTRGGSDAILWLSNERTERWGYTVLGGVHRQAKEDVSGNGWADLPEYRRASVRPRLFWNDGRGSSLFFTVGGMMEDREGGTLAGRTTPAGTSFTDALETRRADVGFVGRTLLGGVRPLTVRGSAMAQRHGHRFDDVLEDDSHATAFVEATLAGTDGNHAWVVGAALQHDRYRADPLLRPLDFSFTVPGIFLQDEYSPTRWLTFGASGRLDAHSEYGNFFNPRLSLLLRPGEWVVRASAGTGFFAPTPLTEETEALGLSRLESFGPLEPERARSASLDIGREVGEFELNGTLFGSEIRDALVTEITEDGGLTLDNLEAPVRTWGVELLARYHAGPIHLTATHSYTRSTEPEPEPEPEADADARREVPLTPRHVVGAVGAWEDEDRGRFGVELYYTGRQALERNPYRTESRPYVILGFLAERRFGRARVFLNAENLLDARQTRWDPVILPSRSTDGRWITDLWAPLDGRVFNAGVRVAF